MRATSLFLVLLFCCVAVQTASPAESSSSNLSKPRQNEVRQLATQLSKLSTHKIYVADFACSQEPSAPQGVYFAAIFSMIFSKHAPELQILSRVDAQSFLKTNHWTSADLATPEVLSQFMSHFKLDSVLHGTVSWTSNSYSIDFVAQDASGKELLRDHFEEPRGPATDGFFPAPGSHDQPPFHFAGLDGVKFPRMDYAPNPSYTEHARARRISGVVIVSAVVTAQGRLSNLWVVESLDPELDASSIQTLSQWRLTPAAGPDGNPVPVRAPFEVTFKLY